MRTTEASDMSNWVDGGTLVRMTGCIWGTCFGGNKFSVLNMLSLNDCVPSKQKYQLHICESGAQKNLELEGINLVCSPLKWCLNPLRSPGKREKKRGIEEQNFLKTRAQNQTLRIQQSKVDQSRRRHIRGATKNMKRKIMEVRRKESQRGLIG